MTQMEFVIDMPIRIGCFNVSSGTLDSTPSVTSDQTPPKCLTFCMKKNPLDPLRFAGLTNGEECHCFGRMPLEQLTSLPEEKCSKSCLGDSNQFCGGEATFSFFVATCPMGQKRFGDYCYQQLDIEQSIESNADSCTEKGMYLWWPDTEEEAVFVQKAFQGVDFRHVGYQFASHERGMLHADNSLGTGIIHLTIDFAQQERFQANDTWYLMSSDRCAVIDEFSIISISEPCPVVQGLCKSKLAMGGGNEVLGASAQADFYSPHLITNPQSFLGIGRHHIGLSHDSYQTQKYLDIRFPHKIIIKALLIETVKEKYVKSFKMKTSSLDFIKPGDLEYIKFYKDAHMVFRVFESSSLEMKTPMSKAINLPTPIMTRHIKIEVLEAAQEVNMRLDFIGMSAIKSYNYHPYMDQNYTLDHVVPTSLIKPDVAGRNTFKLLKKEMICPGGEIIYRGKVKHNPLTYGCLILKQGSKQFYVELKQINGGSLLSIGGTMGRGGSDVVYEIPDRFNSSVGQDFEIQINCKRDRMEVFFKGDYAQTVYSTHDVIPNIESIAVGWSYFSSAVFIRYKDVQPFGLMWPFMAANSLDFPLRMNGLKEISSFAIVEPEGAYFQMYSKGDKNFGYNPIEFVQNCYNTITGNVRCFPGSLVRSTNLFGGDLDGKETKECPSGFNYLGKECVKLDTILRSETYWDAKKKCSEKDHMLYVPTDQDQNLAFRASLRHKSDTPTSHDIWIGVELASTSDIWMTVQGAELTAMTSDWAPGYPDMTFSEAKCAIASKVLDYQWMNVDCYQPRPYLCSPMAPACPKGYTWIPEAGRSCFKITEPLGQSPSYMSSDSIHMTHDMCRTEGTRLAVFQTVEERNAIHSYRFDPVTGESASFGATSMSTPCGQLQMRGGHLNQVRVECFKKDPSFVSYGLCQSSQCFTTSGMVCAFPFRFKGRMYDQCITLGSKNGRPWCSTKTDRDHNHIDGMEADCNADCSVNNCPIGYQRLYGTQTCYKLSPSHPAKMASSFERAQDSCSLDGGRLLQPRSKSALQTMKNVEQFTVFQSTIISHVALGLMVHFESGLVKLYYSDGTMVPFKVQESMMEWDDSFPEEDATKACVAIMTVTGKLRNVPCQGYFNGTNEGHGKLGYICEARPIETLEADPIQVCHLPFIYNSTRHVGCAQSVHASTEMDTQGFPWCATEVNDRGEMVPGKWGKCRDERTIAYDNAVGHYCSVPFLMNKRYYDSCTRHATTPSALNRYYWCPIPSEASLNVSYSNVGIKGSCTDFLIPEENGCGDHYDDVGDMCMRVSTFPVNFDEAVEACNQDGADLIAIVDDVIRDAAIKLIEKKRLQFEHFRNMNYFWIAGRFSNQSQWHWTTHFQPFNKYTQWQANTPNYACKSTGCTHLNALLMQRDEDYSWRAADLGEQFGYVCLSKCSKGYTWYSKVQKCLKVVSYGAQNEKKRNLPQSLVQCGKDQGSLVALRSCQEMEMLNQQLADFFYPVDQVFQIGVFGFLKDPQANRHAPTDQLTDSRGYSMGLSTTFEKSRGLCDAKDSLLTDTLEESKTYGFGLKRAKGGLVTFHQEIVAQASQMSSYGYICHQEPIFGCPEGYAIFQDKCIKVFHQEQTKIDAEMTCRKDGAHLAKPSTHLEIQFIDELIRESEREMGITDLRDYWLGYNRQLDGDLDPLGLWNTTKHQSQNGLPMAVGLENPSGMSCTTPSSCGFLWMDENNTPANFSTFSESKIPDLKGDVESRCVGITDSGNFETVLCSSEMTSLCQFQCPSGVDTQFTDCMTLEHFGPGHILLQSKCTEQAGFVCSKDQFIDELIREPWRGKWASRTCEIIGWDIIGNLMEIWTPWDYGTPPNINPKMGYQWLLDWKTKWNVLHYAQLRGFLWMDENNTPANFSTFSESKIPDLKGDVESRCVGITDSGTLRPSSAPFHGVDTQFTDCMTLEHFGPGHILLQSKCTEQAGFVCSKDQTVKPTLVEDAAEPVVLAPLNKALGSKDISKQGIVLEDHFVGYASFGQKSRLIGYPMLGGQSMSGLSYIEIKSGPEKFVFGTGLTVMFWLKIDQSPMDNFPLLEWVHVGLERGQPRMTKAGEWNFVAFSFDEIKDEGTFYNGDKFGYNQNEMDHIHAHFNGNGSLKVGDALKLPGLIGKDQFNDSRTFHGSLSCLQIFNKGMLPSYVRFHKHCQNASSQVTDPCPEGFDFFDGMCYKIAISLASFIEAEIACSSNRDETGRYRSQLMWTRKREHYEFVQLGESEFWVGLDDLAGLGEFETSTGGEFVNRSDPIWAILNAGQGDCAKIPGPNGGFLTTDVCSKPLAYVCQQRPLYESPDNHCPDGFFSYKSSCLLPVREEMEFNQAQIHCGLHGSSLYASKSLADFQFIKQYARNHSTNNGTNLIELNKTLKNLVSVRIDIWMGVERKSVIQSFDASEDNALEALETNDKSYADGAEFFDSTSFGFEFTSNGGIWQGPCPNPEHRFNTQLETRNAPRSTPSFANGNSRIF
ncbi:hypothetical protein TCAL_13095 [Tigriopus californicus]|uniref:C-type lectin domain-containing protein n=1 Tax=Tigriopus californicus TaxID=6832 RepID=A0A553PLD0_TIGCA|nr:hypothetical protein TCAL_13095 [Tigriopus californicus]